MKITLTVERSSPSTTKAGGYVNLLKGTTTMKVFGVPKTTHHFFTMKTDEQLQVGAEEEVNLDNFTIKEFEHEYMGRKVTNRWLLEKVA